MKNELSQTEPGDDAPQSRILLTDDDPRMLDSLRLLLELQNHHIDTASGGQEAIDKLSNIKYDLLLLDLKMPEVTGHDVMRYMASCGIPTLTIVVSGESSANDISSALRLGAYDYIKKPYAPLELLSTVKNALRKKFLEDSHATIQKRLNRSERLHRFIVNNSPDIIFMLDDNGNFSFINSKIESLLAYKKGGLLGQNISTLIADDDLEKANYFLEYARSPHADVQHIELLLKPFSKDERKRHFEVSLWPIDEIENKKQIDSDQRHRIYGTAREITEQLEAQARINFQTYHDLLTQLPNRVLFKDRLSVAISQAQRSNSLLAVMLIDLDRFKIINDSLGHNIGDKLLQAVGERLQSSIRKGDTLARFGGDEFTLLLPEISGQESAGQIAEKILSDIKRPFSIGEHEVFIGASIGIAIFPESGDNLESLIKNADIAMYRVKKTGKDGFQLFNNALDAVAPNRLNLEHDIRRAIKNEEFEVCYQPQVFTHDETICGVEALVRWNHPQLGRLSPSEFIPIAEESQLIVDLDRYTLRKACREILHYHKNGLPDLRLSVNLSPVMIEKKDFVEDILKTLKEEQYPANLLELEITENILLNDRKATADKLLLLANEGIHFAIDDFGTGYSSLSYLQDFPINTLKIDRSFINSIENTEAEDACIVDAIVAMAKGLKMSIIAEGVENHEQLSYLRDLGCDVIQGFLFGHAMKLEQLVEKFRSAPL